MVRLRLKIRLKRESRGSALVGWWWAWPKAKPKVGELFAQRNGPELSLSLVDAVKNLNWGEIPYCEISPIKSTHREP